MRSVIHALQSAFRVEGLKLRNGNWVYSEVIHWDKSIAIWISKNSPSLTLGRPWRRIEQL